MGTFLSFILALISLLSTIWSIQNAPENTTKMVVVTCVAIIVFFIVFAEEYDRKGDDI